jgi:hypothetical protein
MAALPPLGLEVQVASIDGSDAVTLVDYTTDVRRLASIGEITRKLHTGFESASVHTERDQRLQYSSPRRLQELKIKGAGGFSLHEGRVSKVPRDRNDDVNSVGWLDHLKDNSGVAEVYRDVSMERWGSIPLARQAALLLANFTPQDGASESGGVKLGFPGLPWTATGLPCTESWYTAPPGVNLASLTFGYARTNANWSTADASFDLNGFLATDDALASYDATSDLAGSASGTGGVAYSTTGRRYAILRAAYGAAVGGADSLERAMLATGVTVAGDHGLTNIYASEVIKHVVGKYAPLISATDATIEANTYEIPQLVADGWTVVQVIEKVNGFHLWRYGLQENRTLYWHPQKDLNDYDFEIPTQGDFKGYLDPAGPEVDDEDPCSGYWVYYTDAQTGRRERVGPLGTSTGYDADGDALLLATSESNDCVREDQNRFPPIDISYPVTRADAITIGAIKLISQQTKVNAGTGTADGYVKNRAGSWVPAYTIKEGDRVKFGHETNTIREVFSTKYNPATYQMSLEFEKPASTATAIQERQQAAIQAALAQS